MQELAWDVEGEIQQVSDKQTFLEPWRGVQELLKKTFLSLSKNFVIEVNSESYTDLYYIEIDFIR
jgi:hypothetical protein